MTSRPLLASVAESIVILAPIVQVGWRAPAPGSPRPSSSGGRVEERAARRGQDERRRRPASPPRRGTARSPSAPSRSGAARRAGWRTGRGIRGARPREAPSERHDEVAAGDERLLVGRGDDLAGLERGEHRAQADHAAGRRRRRGRRRRAWPARRGRRGPPTRPVPAGRSSAASVVSSARATAAGRSRAACSASSASVGARGQRDDPEGVRVRREDVDRLAPIDPVDPRSATRRGAVRRGCDDDIQGHDRRRRRGTSRPGRACRRGPGSGCPSPWRRRPA